MIDSDPTYCSALTAPVPPGWWAEESLVVHTADEQGEVDANVQPVPADTTVEQAVSIQHEMQEAEFPGFREHTREACVVLGDRPGILRRFSWVDGEVEVTQVQVCHVADGRVFTATATTPAARADELLPALLDVVFGLRLRT